MQRSIALTVAAAAVFACIQVSSQAQTFVKPQPRPNPSVSDTVRVPAGVDTGSPATSDSLPLGTPVPPVGSIDRRDQSTRSAAARAAARPAATRSPLAATSTTSTGLQAGSNECASGSEAAFHRAMSACSNIANRSDRASCAARAAQDRADGAVVVQAAPVALPGSGFVGSSATPTAVANATATTNPARGPNRLGCI